MVDQGPCRPFVEIPMTSQIIPVQLFDLVVFGATGDLAMRKLLPALYWRENDLQMPEGSRIIGAARRELTTEAYLDLVEAACRKHVAGDFDEAVFARLARRITYVPLDVAGRGNWAALAAALEGGQDRARLFYLATSPDLFGPISAGAGAAGIVTPNSRVVLEKPIGRDLASAIRINDEVGRVFAESQVYRIDHYLGKESVQNLLALRFANSLFEAVWNRAHIDHVQITVSETVGVEERAAYYDKSGAMRDMVQNHILQLLCLVAMEPPISMAANSVRDEKLKVLHSLRPLSDGDALLKTVRGQYRAGSGGGAAVPGYLEELGHASRTETFVAIKAQVENWRWAGDAVLPAHRQAPAGPGLGDRDPVPPGAALDLPTQCRAGGAQPAGHPAAARRRHPAGADGQGPGSGRHAAADGTPRHSLRRCLQGALP